MDEINLRTLFERELSYVRRSLARLGVARDDLDDLAQEVFMVVVRKHAEIDQSRPIRPFLFGICFRCALAQRRFARSRREVAWELVEQEQAFGLAAPTLEAQDAARLTFAGLACLPIEQRAVVVLHDLDGWNMREVAMALEIPVDTGYGRLRRGRAELAVALKRLRLDTR